MKGKFKRQHQILRHLWKSFLFFQSFRARRWVHAELAQTLLTWVGPYLHGDGISASGTSLLQTTNRIYSRNPPKSRPLASNHVPKMGKSFKHVSFQKMGLPILSASSCLFQGTFAVHRAAHSSRLAKDFSTELGFTWWSFPSPQSTVVCLHVLLLCSWAEQRWSRQPKERLTDCWGISLSPCCVNRD